MLINNPIPPGEYRHNYVRLAFLVGTLLLFIGHIVVNQLHERSNNRQFIKNNPFNISMIRSSGIFPNATLHAEDLVVNDITPSDWVYQGLDALNYLWQVKSRFDFEGKKTKDFISSLLGFCIH